MVQEGEFQRFTYLWICRELSLFCLKRRFYCVSDHDCLETIEIMTKKELRKLSRAELLELLIGQTKEVSALEEKLAQMQQENDQLSAQLADRQIVMQEAGSIAEASLRLNGVFDTAEKAAQEYLENIRLRNEALNSFAQEAEAKAQAKIDAMMQQAQADEAEAQARVDALLAQADLIETEAKQKADVIILEAQERSERLESETKSRCDEMLAKAERDSDAYWKQVSKRFGDFVKLRDDARATLAEEMRRV